MRDGYTVPRYADPPERGGSFIDLLLALVIVSVTAMSLMESRHRAFESFRSFSAILSRALDTTITSEQPMSACTEESFVILCGGDSTNEAVYFIGP